MRIGIGYDVHRLVEDRKLIIGGVEIPHEKGLLGHSDADVLTHAIIDAIFGALALGDLGRHFPDNDEKFRGANSLKLLEYAVEKMDSLGYKIGNIDSTIMAESPKMSPFIQSMRENISKYANTDLDRINIKATTEEGLGFTGEKLGISANAVVLLMEK